jgi:uncharacterized protein YkuJ
MFLDRTLWIVNANIKGKSHCNEGRRGTMSQLQGILTRLISLQEKSDGGEPPQRFFEVNGEKKCSVKYFDKTSTFELEIYQQGEKPKSYQFDNVDMIAIEIFDLIN